jgi:SRSO17 transposase
MGLKSGRRSNESRFAAYVEALSSALGHADRAVSFHSYCAVLLLPGDRKSVEPMAVRLQPGRVRQHASRCTTSWQNPIGRMKRCWQRSGCLSFH